MKISDIDPNFRIDTEIDKTGLYFTNVRKEPFSLYGIYHEGGKYRRIPLSLAESLNANIVALHTNTAGGRVRFYTNSLKIAIRAEMENVYYASHMPLTGAAGFDLYEVLPDRTERYVGSFRPPVSVGNGYESALTVSASRTGYYTIHFPLYSDVRELYVGVTETATLSEGMPYRPLLPVVYYGSSITQGGCASRPGNAYQNVLSRELSVDHVNLGFSGNAKGEQAMAEHIASLPMSLFVLDYDHNAPTLEHLIATHENFYLTFRRAQPKTPILFLSRPSPIKSTSNMQRLEVIRTTYENALKSGDQNVYFLEGQKLISLAGYDGTVDGTHPNDLGFYSMAQALKPVLASILEKED